MKSKTKKIMSFIFIFAVLGGFAIFLAYLSSASLETAADEQVYESGLKADEKQGYVKVLENDRLRLFFDPALVLLKIEDKENGSVWLSNPENPENDKIAFGQNKSLIKSLLDVTYIDEQGSPYTVNSFMGSVSEKTYSCEIREDGVFIDFSFDDQGFEIPCFFTLSDDRFVARILSEDIKQHGKLKISKISLLPFFGAGGLDDDGYMMVPDGSGAIIKFNNDKQTYQPYIQPVYGRNLAVNLNTNLIKEQNATMPVFGIKKNDDAFLAVITKGEYQSELRANVSRKMTSNNTVYSSVVYIQSESNTLMAGSGDEETATMQSPQNTEGIYEVSYFFLQKNAGYTQMASRYRDYLELEKGMKKQSEPQKTALIDFLGGIKVQKTFLGVPYRAVEPLTTFAEAGSILTDLQDSGAESLLGAMTFSAKNGTESKLPVKQTFDGKLGGKNGYKNMMSLLDKNDIGFYLINDPIYMKKSGAGYTGINTIRNVTRSEAVSYNYKLTTGKKDNSLPKSRIISSVYVPKIVTGLTNSCLRNNMDRLGLSSIGCVNYSDYRKKSISANKTGEYLESALNSADRVDHLLFEGAFAYSFPYADVITKAPVSSSRYDIEDMDIPFYEMVVSGYSSLYSDCVNLSGDEDCLLLRLAAFGVRPAFLVMSKEQSILQNTDYRKYYAASYSDNKEFILNTVSLFNKLDITAGKTITDFEWISGDLSKTTYDDGLVVLVNFSDKDIDCCGITVKAKDFEVKEGTD